MKKAYCIWALIGIGVVSIAINIGLYIQYQGIKNEKDQLIIMNRNYLESLEKKSESSDLDELYKNELDNVDGGVTSKLIEVLIKYANLWEEEMDKYYYLLMDTLDEDNKAYLANSQKLWETYSNENIELILQSNKQLYGGGSYLSILDADLIYQRYKDRANEFIELYRLFDFKNY